MLKYIKDGKVKYVQMDEDTEPREVKEFSEAYLKMIGITIEDDDEESKAKKKTPKKSQGISQDDVKHIRGE